MRCEERKMQQDGSWQTEWNWAKTLEAISWMNEEAVECDTSSTSSSSSPSLWHFALSCWCNSWKGLGRRYHHCAIPFLWEMWPNSSRESLGQIISHGALNLVPGGPSGTDRFDNSFLSSSCSILIISNSLRSIWNKTCPWPWLAVRINSDIIRQPRWIVIWRLFDPFPFPL